jgi:ribosomal-protein-alanine N-acetyltransferase
VANSTVAVSNKKSNAPTMKLPPYNTFPIISGDKISLREIITADLEDLIEISFYDSIQATTFQQATEMQDKINKDYIEGNSIHWGIANNLTNKIIGTCGYYRGLDQGTGELGCVLLPQYRGQGFMTSAMLLAIDFGINSVGLKRVWAITTKQNEKAIKLLKNLNFIKIADLDDNEIEYELKQNTIFVKNYSFKTSKLN